MTESIPTPEIRIDDYDYPLPDERIAKHPLTQRDSCKLLVSKASTDGTPSLSTHTFAELPSLLDDGSLMVCNNTRVINARLRFRKGADESGALIEVFCLEPADHADFAVTFASTEGCAWNCFVGNSKRWKEGALTRRITLPDGTAATLEARRRQQPAGEGGVQVVEFTIRRPEGLPPVSFSEIIEAAGEIPIPPYLNRRTEESDADDYQTVFGRIEGSVAAPTAGLHFTPELLSRLAESGIERRELTLHVGAGTFQPVKAETIAGHTMHSEFIAVGRDLIETLRDSAGKRKIVAVGTTSVRTLESLYHLGCLASTGADLSELPQWFAYSPAHPRLSMTEAMQALLERMGPASVFAAATRLLIAPGYTYKVVDEIITNFHQPRSTLLLLVSAFTGGRWREIYDYALGNGYRFLSYGDACLLRR